MAAAMANASAQQQQQLQQQLAAAGSSQILQQQLLQASTGRMPIGPSPLGSGAAHGARPSTAPSAAATGV
jgi:hypothetical protein